MRYNLSLAALGFCALLFLGTFFSSFQNVNPPLIEVDDIEQVETATTMNTATKDAAPIKISSSVMSLKDTISFYTPWLVMAWLFGVLLFSIRFIASYYFLRNLKLIGVQNNDDWQEVVDKAAQFLGIKRPVQFLLSSITKQPLTFGFFKPVILIPIGLINQLDPTEVESIISHELSHIRRNDYLVNLIQSIIEVLFFYHPAIWVLSNDARRIREEACDDQVVASGRDPLVYAQALLKTKNIFH